MSIAAIFLSIMAIDAFIAVVEIVVFYWLDEYTDEEFFENKYRDPYDYD